MRESAKFWLSCTPFLLIGVAVLLSSSFSEFMAQRQAEVWKRDPLAVEVTVSSVTDAYSGIRTQTTGNVLLCELGLLRLALPVKGARGGSFSSGTRIATASTSGGGGSSGSSGGSHHHSYKEVAYGSHHEFSGPGYDFKFDVRHGCLCIDDQRICIVDTPKLVVPESSGAIKSVTELSVSYPPLTGSPVIIAALIDRAQQYAKLSTADATEFSWRTDALAARLEVTTATEAASESRIRVAPLELIFETAFLRLVIPAANSTRGNSHQAQFLVATTKPGDEVQAGLEGWSSSSPATSNDYRKWRAGCGTHHIFVGPGYKYTFDIIQGCLCIKGQRVSIVDTPKLVILNPDGSIKSVCELTVDSPKPTGKPEDIKALVKTAREFAERFQPSLANVPAK